MTTINNNDFDTGLSLAALFLGLAVIIAGLITLMGLP